jgi:hypothetical protein
MLLDMNMLSSRPTSPVQYTASRPHYIEMREVELRKPSNSSYNATISAANGETDIGKHVPCRVCEIPSALNISTDHR